MLSLREHQLWLELCRVFSEHTTLAGAIIRFMILALDAGFDGLLEANQPINQSIHQSINPTTKQHGSAMSVVESCLARIVIR